MVLFFFNKNSFFVIHIDIAFFFGTCIQEIPNKRFTIPYDHIVNIPIYLCHIGYHLSKIGKSEVAHYVIGSIFIFSFEYKKFLFHFCFIGNVLSILRELKTVNHIKGSKFILTQNYILFTGDHSSKKR